MGWHGSVDGKEGKKRQWNYHCFNIQISFISLMLAQTKFITLLRRRQVQGGWGRARAALRWECCFLPPPALQLPQLQHPAPHLQPLWLHLSLLLKGHWKTEKMWERTQRWWRRNRKAGPLRVFFSWRLVAGGGEGVDKENSGSRY